jgi:hypothetical protein
VDGAPIGPEDGASPFSMSWKTSSVKNGTHTLRATARDAAGNTTSSDLVVTVRNLVKSDASAGGCTTADPFLAMGGGYCVAGGWTPWIPEMEFGDTALSAPETSLASSESTGSCSLPDPFAILGGGTCSLGGWLPPGMPVTSPSPTTPTVAPNQVATVSVSTQTSGACTTPDPFVTLGGGICIGGGWVPKGLVVGGR